MSTLYGSGFIDPRTLNLVSNGEPSVFSIQNLIGLNISEHSSDNPCDSLRTEDTSSIRPGTACRIFGSRQDNSNLHEASARPCQCAQCGADFQQRQQLLAHAKERAHKPYACRCGQPFARIDALSRHVKSMSDAVPEYPCQLCPERGGIYGFRRQDHLVQHLTGRHNIDPEMLQTSSLITRQRPAPSESRRSPSQRLQNQAFDGRLLQNHAHPAEFMGGVHHRMMSPLPAPTYTAMGAVNLMTDNTLNSYQVPSHTLNPSGLSDPANGYAQLPFYPQQTSEGWGVDFSMAFDPTIDPTINPTGVCPFYGL